MILRSEAIFVNKAEIIESKNDVTTIEMTQNDTNEKFNVVFDLSANSPSRTANTKKRLTDMLLKKIDKINTVGNTPYVFVHYDTHDTNIHLEHIMFI